MLGLVFLFALLSLSSGLEFEAPTLGKKCLYYHFNKDDIAHGTFSIINRPHWNQVNVIVSELLQPGDTNNVREVSRKNDVPDKGTFAFAAREGEQAICFEMSTRPNTAVGYAVPMRISITLEEKHVPRKGDINTVELEKTDEVLRVMNLVGDSTNQIRTMVIQLHEGLEKRKLKHEEADNGLGKLSFLFFFILILFGGGQLWYLTNFLKKKKLV